jgi:hypothetical protein
MLRGGCKQKRGHEKLPVKYIPRKLFKGKIGPGASQKNPKKEKKERLDGFL